MILIAPSRPNGEYSPDDLHHMMGRQVTAEYQAWADDQGVAHDKDSVIEFMLSYYPEG